jgi:hypothetical protein
VSGGASPHHSTSSIPKNSPAPKPAKSPVPNKKSKG